MVQLLVLQRTFHINRIQQEKKNSNFTTCDILTGHITQELHNTFVYKTKKTTVAKPSLKRGLYTKEYNRLNKFCTDLN